MTIERIWCLITGHDFGRPYTDAGRRVERCEACSTTRDYVWLAPTAERIDQVTVDGTAPVSYTSTAQVLDGIIRAETKARNAEIDAKVKAKHRRPREVSR